MAVTEKGHRLFPGLRRKPWEDQALGTITGICESHTAPVRFDALQSERAVPPESRNSRTEPELSRVRWDTKASRSASFSEGPVR